MFRQRGLSYREIADKLGVGASTALRDVKSGVPDETPDESAEDVALPETITGRDGKHYAATQPAHTPTDEDRARIKAALGDGELHRAVLEQRSLLSSRAFAATLQLMQDTGEILRAGLIYRLPDLPEITPASRDAKKLYAYLVEQGGPVSTADATAACKLTTDEFIRAANLLGATQRLERQRVDGKVMLTAIVPTEPEPGPEQPAPWSADEAGLADVEPETDEAKITHDAEMALEATEAISDQMVDDGDDPPRRGLPLSVETARGLITDALRKSQRPLGRGEIRKYAGIRDEQRDICEAAIDAMLAAGSLAEVHTKGAGRRYHFPYMLQPESTKGETPPAGFTQADVTLALADRAALEKALLDLQDAAQAARRIKGVSSWSCLGSERIGSTRVLIAAAVEGMTALTAQLGDIDRTLAAFAAPAESSSD